MDEHAQEVVKSLIKEGYSDVVGPAAKQVGAALEDLAKCARLFTFPFQYVAQFQDRLDAHLKRVVRNIPAENVVSPPEEIMAPVFDKLRLLSPESTVAEMYQNLLASAMDERYAVRAHPAFIHIISQLSPDEALIVRELSLTTVRAFIRVGIKVLDYYSPQATEREAMLSASAFDESTVTEFSRLVLKPEHLSFPNLFLTYVEHLQSLGLIEYVDPRHPDRIIMSFGSDLDRTVNVFNLSLTGMGQLFFDACMSRQ